MPCTFNTSSCCWSLVDSVCWLVHAGLKVLRLGLSAIRSLSLALPELAVLDVSNCADLWRLQLRCPRLVEAYFQSCR